MESKVARWCYWIGVGGVAASIVWKLLTALDVVPKEILYGEHPLTYRSIMQGALLMLAVTVATHSYVALRK